MSAFEATRALQVIDSHTGGEPTRVVVDGCPSLGDQPMSAQLHAMRREADWVRTALTREPRGADWMVGAVLQRPYDPNCTAGVIFFNNVGYLGMCGHGLIGVVNTLEHLGRIAPGTHQFETPVGIVSACLHEDRSVSIENVVSYRAHKQVSINVPGNGPLVGDVAYGGNWFFLSEIGRLEASMIDELTFKTRRIMDALRHQGVRGDDGSEIDHIELIGPPSDPHKADARSFVLCPGGHYDRSPCGTGTSAKLACLAADGELAPDIPWRQESIIGSVFEATFRKADGGIIPTVTGRAFVTAETSVIAHPDDPFRHGVPSKPRLKQAD